ncbi:TBC1 domain family member 30 isoform X2 [Danio aesculapii]|uniref:TBC1 domain family member 30 isoform X2 n=1 Tax=Danio aesculapii TaxID=1142201 RepID=UPI0024BFB21F|nr:TBC1 domain family member 30 isoform X2 [Danio aesculapii]
MSAVVEVAKEELKEVNICDICPEEESGVFLSAGASYLDGFSGFHKWVSKIEVSDGDCEKTSPRKAHEEEKGGVYSDEEELKESRASSLVECLLVELYDTYSHGVPGLDSSTEASSSDAFLGRSNSGSSFLQELQEKHTRRHQVKYLAQKGPEELKWIVQEVKYRIAVQSAKLVRQAKRKDRLRQKFQKNCDIVTACLQAVSQKRRVDTRLKFTIEPSLGKNGFQQWYDALKAVARLPVGIPKEWRKRVWLTLADQYLHSISIDWEKTMRFAFNDRSNPDDDSLGIQIVKDLHRTGCSSYCGQEAEQDRVVLKRVLLAYARWNKTVGYCQGFNVLAALILEVTEGNEGDALKVMIYLIDKVLPDSYFANNLRALSVDMAVFRDLLRLKLPELSQHLHHLQKVANREAGGSYEPPLTNVFTMQWFLTMFATCLPHHTVLKIWDSVFFEGSEMLLRVALAIWAKLGERIEECQTADEFYSIMGCLTQEMLEHKLIDSNELMQTVYSMAPFPFPQLAELREKYTYNITPFPAPVRANSSLALHGWESDDDADMDDEDSIVTALGCLGPLGGLLAPEIQRYQRHLKDQRAEQSCNGSNMAELSPGAVGAGRAEHQAAINSMMLERMSTDISALKKQYSRIKQKQQQQAGLLYIHTDKCPATSVLASQIGPSPVVNHLLLGRRPRPGQRSLKNGMIHNGGSPQGHSTPLQDQMVRSRHHSPWRTHVRAHRRNIARARAQLGFDDSLEAEDDQTDESKTEGASKEGEETKSEETDEDKMENTAAGGSDVSQQELQEIDSQLSSLELDPESSPDPSTPEPALDPDPQSDPTITPEPQADPNPATPDPNPTTQDPSSTIKNPNSSIQNPSPTIQDSNPTLQNPNSTIQESSPTIQDFNPTLQNPNSTIQETNPTIKDSNSTIQISNSTIQNPNSIVKNPNSTIQNSNRPFQNPNSTVQNHNPTIQDPNPTDQNSNSSIQNPNSTIEEANPSTPSPASLLSTRRPGSDSSSSESGSSFRRSASSLAGDPPKAQQQIYSPFPCIKTPRKSTAARNLGLYGPTARTPNVHFPQMSRSMNRVGNTTKRR